MSEQNIHVSEEHNEISETANDTFLMAEGLELLAAYRVIPDNEVRASILGLVKFLSQIRSTSEPA